MHSKFFEMLKEDHKEVKEILGLLEETKETAPKKREELFQKLLVELVPHMKAEETAFYPPLLAKEESREAALEGVEEHHVSEMVLKELEKMPKDTDEWGAKICVFAELVEHHIEEEEDAVFKSAEVALNHDEIQEIMEKFDIDKQKIKKNMK